MSKKGRGKHLEKYSDKELAALIVKLQEKQPLFTEASICRELGVHRTYLHMRAKRSPLVEEARAQALETREDAWVARGIDGMVNKKEFSEILYIWMTRNILKWRDKKEEVSSIVNQLKAEIEKLQTEAQKNGKPDAETIAEAIRRAREAK
jgi:hypothetical protein